MSDTALVRGRALLGVLEQAQDAAYADDCRALIAEIERLRERLTLAAEQNYCSQCGVEFASLEQE